MTCTSASWAQPRATLGASWPAGSPSTARSSHRSALAAWPRSQSMRPRTRFRAGLSRHCSTCRRRLSRPCGLAGVQEGQRGFQEQLLGPLRDPAQRGGPQQVPGGDGHRAGRSLRGGGRFQFVGQGVVGPVGGRHPVGQHAVGRQHPGGRAVEVAAAGGREVLVDRLPVEGVGELDRKAPARPVS